MDAVPPKFIKKLVEELKLEPTHQILSIEKALTLEIKQLPSNLSSAP